MAFTRKALKARRAARQSSGGSLTRIMKEGEQAAVNGQSLTANPYQGEDAEIWAEGWNDASTGRW